MVRNSTSSTKLELKTEANNRLEYFEVDSDYGRRLSVLLGF